MRGLLTFIVIAGIGAALFVVQKRSEQKRTATEASAHSKIAANSQKTLPHPRSRVSMKRARPVARNPSWMPTQGTMKIC
jgi:hypothetical protein